MSETLKPARLLIVDDVPANIKVLAQSLRSKYDILVATNGTDALRLVATERPDLILLDIVMPEMDGHEVCRRLKSNAESRDIPIIFITAMGDEEDETKGLELGAVDYITKPFRISIVLARVKTHLRLKKAMEEIAIQNKELLAADKMREDVDRIMRHDLRSPLSTIISFSSYMLESKPFDEEDRESLRIISDSGYRLLNMISRSLNLYRMERGTYELNPSPVNLLETIHKIIKSYEKNTIKKIISIQFLQDHVPPDVELPFYVNGEELLCFSLFANLMKNAVEAAPEMSRIDVFIKRLSEDVEVSIHNAGEVPESIKGRFFDKYVTSGKSGGTGLGTYSAKLMAQTQNGSIGFESSRETGTMVTVRLPVP